jgi:hypothetical protein
MTGALCSTKHARETASQTFLVLEVGWDYLETYAKHNNTALVLDSGGQVRHLSCVQVGPQGSSIRSSLLQASEELAAWAVTSELSFC